VKKVLVKYQFPWWRVVVYSSYELGAAIAYTRPEKFFSKVKAKALAKEIRFSE